MVPASELLALFRAIASGKQLQAIDLLDSSPRLALLAAEEGATRQESQKYFLALLQNHLKCQLQPVDNFLLLLKSHEVKPRPHLMREAFESFNIVI